MLWFVYTERSRVPKWSEICKLNEKGEELLKKKNIIAFVINYNDYKSVKILKYEMLFNFGTLAVFTLGHFITEFFFSNRKCEEEYFSKKNKVKQSSKVLHLIV